MVANSGVTLIENIDKTNVAKIERIQIDTDTLQEDVSTKTDVTQSLITGNQYSEEGLYHYIIYMKDYVENEVSQNEVPQQNINSVSGSTLHKLVYINNNEDAYTYFNELNFIKNSGNFSELFTTIPGKHIKNYLINSQGFTTQMIDELNYEQLIKY